MRLGGRKFQKDQELEQAIRRFTDRETLHAFRGIYPRDTLPSGPIRPPVFLILNTDTHNLPGKHWKVIFIDHEYNGEVFDSLALPLSDHVIRFMNIWSRKWSTNTQAYQHPFSAQCGIYVLYFILQRLHVPSMSALCQLFTSDLFHNERMMHNFYRYLK